MSSRVWSKPAVLLGTLALLGAGGCSFRYPTHVTGQVAALSVPDAHPVNTPLILVGQAQFKGNFENPVLSVVYPSSDEKVIRVGAVASPKQPFMGWGIFANATSVTTVEVRGSIVVEKPGQYVIESLPTEAGAPSFQGTLDVR
ncbi:hypothetical protein D3C72_845660 [compost metagenome]